MGVVVRLCVECDRDKCLDIARDLRDWFSLSGLEKMAVDLRLYDTHCAYLDGELAGFINLKYSATMVEIVWLAVKREFQGHGVGTALLGYAEEVARRRGVGLMVVKTSGDLGYEPYTKTRRFYESRGFMPILSVNPYPEWGEPMILYVKCL